MIAFSDPPPLPVRVQSLKQKSEAPPTFDAPVVGWAIVILLIAVGGIVASTQRRQLSANDSLAAAMTNSLPREVARGVLATLPVGTPLQDVRKTLATIHATCRTVSAADTAMICLGTPIVRANTFVRERIRFDFRADALTTVHACPTFVHWSRTPVPTALAERVAHPLANDCWRDDANLADNEWTYATLPDKPFTTVTVHAADSVRRKAEPTADTLVVRW